MTRYIIIHTLQEYIYSLRFFISLVLVLLVYSVSTLSFIIELKDLKTSHEELASAEMKEMKEKAEKSATELIVSKKEYVFSPRNNSFISQSNEDIIPNTIIYSGYGVLEAEKSKGKSNPFVLPTESINWQFIIVLLFSFLAIIFSYDVVSGEKDTKTLSLCLSNSVSKGQFLMGKFLGVLLVIASLLIIGTITSLIILAISPAISVTFLLLAEIAGFFLLSLLILIVMASLGMFSSVLFSNSDLSLLIGISAWLVFIFIIPNTALLLSNALFPIEKNETVHERYQAKRAEIDASYPEGKWSSRGDDLFYPRHEIRANMQMDFFNAYMQIYHEHSNNMLNQLENTRKLTWLSPLSIMGYGTEHLIDGGYPRFKKNWNDIQEYQETLLKIFKEIDANDEESPHWYNPYENYSTTRKPVSFEEVPKFEERVVPFEKRLKKASVYAGIIVLYAILFMMLAFGKFMKYDVR